MKTIQTIHNAFNLFLNEEKQVPLSVAQTALFTLNTDPEKQAFGDINSNIAMICAPLMKKNPRTLAQEFADTFQHPLIERIEVAGPGFLNFFLRNAWFSQIAQDVVQHGDQAFVTPPHQAKKIHIEFVSANPTGPMHVGHGRNGILGDVLAQILSFVGHSIHKEFYINDAGAQIQKLGNSFKIRCLQKIGHTQQLPEDAYHGEYLINVAEQCVTEFGSNVEHESDNFFQIYAKDQMLKQLQETLQSYGILFDTWFSEKYLHDHGLVTVALKRLIDAGHTYEQDGALWFRSTTFGDDKDRVLIKTNGELTYMTAEIAYLIDKLQRGYDELIMVLGHDHHSYKTRIQGIMQALGFDPKRLNVILYQLVHVIKDGQPVKMSKRSGNMVTLEEIIQEVGKDVARFFFLYRKADAELQFDITLALTQSNENPIYYIQYAHVRTVSMQKRAQQEGLNVPSEPIEQEYHAHEKLIIKKIASLPTLLEQIASNHQIHLLAHYTYELANLLHVYYNQHRVIDPENPLLTQHRLYIIKLMQQTLRTSMFIMGITPIDVM